MNPLLPRPRGMRALLLAAFALTAAGAAAQPPNFDPPAGYGVPLVPWNALLPGQGDFNNDGHVDMLVSNGDRVQVLLGSGTGTFAILRPSYFSKQLNGWNVAVGDVDNDGNLDIAAGSNVDWGKWYLSVALGNGDGTFADVVSYNMPCCGGVRTTTFADLNGDGWLDMIGGESGVSIRVFINNQDGTFPVNGSSNVTNLGNNPQDAAAGDFNNDGKADVVFANRDAGGSVQAMLGNGAGALIPQPLLALTAGEAGRNLAVADFNGDHCDDIANINWSGRAVDVYLSHCNGTFSTLTSYVFDPAGPTAFNGYRIADEIVDLDGNGTLDLVVSNSAGRGRSGKALFVLPGNGDGTFGTASSHPNPVEPPAPPCCAWVNENIVFPLWVSAVDLNEDGRPDLMTAANNDRPIAVLLNSNPDSDGDGVPDDEDAFPSDPTESSDSDGDGVGDNGDAFPNDPAESADTDSDSVGDDGDNCSAVANSDQPNTDGDGSGDACDADDDNDGVPDASDRLPLVADVAPPDLILPGNITVLATSASGAPVSYSASANDAHDGAMTAVCAPASGSSFPIGTTSVTCSATDAASHSVQGSFTVTVSYNVCLLYDTTKVHNGGSTIPVKLRLCSASGQNLSSPSVVVTAFSLVQLSANADGVVEDSGQANPDGNFRYDAALGGYIFNLQTKGLIRGEYELRFTAGAAPGSGSAPFKIR